jgi:hypothetical protein
MNRQSVLISGDYSPTMDVGAIICDTTNDVANILLPSIINSNADQIGYQVVIQDGTNSASVNNIIITAVGGELINGLPSVTIEKNGGSIALIPFASKYWIAFPIDSSLGKLKYQGTWNANTNTPTLGNGGAGGVNGDYYVVNVAGSTSIDGVNDWEVGDWIINNGITWQKIDNSDVVTSVNGLQGAVQLGLSNILAQDNTTGAYNISINSGQGVVYNNGGFTNTINTSVLTANRVISYPDDSGVVSLVGEQPLWSMEKQYLLSEDFDKGIIPSGWASSTSGGTITYTQNYETTAIGQAFLTANRGAGATRAGMIYGSNYLLRLDDCLFTRWYGKARRALADVGMCQFGFANSNSSTPSTFGNMIVIMHDPNNMSGKNPTLITNWCFVTNRVGFSFNCLDTGIAPNGTWQNFMAEFNNVGTPTLTMKVNGVVTNTITNMTNVPVVLASGQSFAPSCYAGSTIGAVGANSIRLDKFSVFRKWS